LGFIANYTGHGRIVGELNDAHKKTIDELIASHNSEIETLNQSQHAEIERLNQEYPTGQAPDLYGKIKEVYFKRSGYGLYITLRVFIGNRGADTTIQPFVLKFLLNGREYIALEEDDVTDYGILRTIDKPLWPTMSREETYEELTDLSADNLKPLDRHRHREGWLRFRIPRLTAYTRGEGGELTLELLMRLIE
jgi:hypothetical protein